MAGVSKHDEVVNLIKPSTGWELINFKELREYRDLFYFLVWRDIKVIYAQTILGFAWAILNPLAQIIIFSIVFGNVAKVSSDGFPYILFSSVAVIPWTYMAEAMQHSSQSLVTGQALLDKIYFPRLLFPITGVLSKLVDFGISLIILVGLLVYFRVSPTDAFQVIDSHDGDSARGDYAGPYPGIVRPMTRWSTQFNSNELVVK